MAYWWVNHKQTAKSERSGGYIWSPRKEKNGARSEGYENVNRVALGDIIFSYANGTIGAIGVATSKAFNTDRPLEFGKVGQQWDKNGWQVNVAWQFHDAGLVVKSVLAEILPYLPSKYSPIQHNGNGNQKLYLTSIGEEIAKALLQNLPSPLIFNLSLEAEDQKRVFEAQVETARIETLETLSVTEKEQLTKSRIGQGIFRERVDKREQCCRITGVKEKALLIASHIKPWARSSNAERLDGENGFFLSPHVDKLFDKGYLSFTADGFLLVSEELPAEILNLWHIDVRKNYGPFTPNQSNYLDFHRDNVFKRN